MPADRPELKVTHSDGICVVEFADRKILEELSINQIGEELTRLAEQHQPTNLLLNFKNV